MGRMFDADGREWEAQWWQSAPPSGIQMEYLYRILPHLEPTLQAQLEQQQDGDVSTRYIFTGLGVIGLYVLAFHGVSLNTSPGPDTITAPAYLLRPLVPAVRDALAAWKQELKKNEPSGQFEIASAGVIGEPLYVKALQAAGLEPNEIKLLGNYYQLYSE
jgi:hypothetical protein